MLNIYIPHVLKLLKLTNKHRAIQYIFPLKQQKLPFGLTEMLTKWAEKIEQALYSSAQGRMLSEWAKKEACWDAVRNFSVSMTRSLLEQKNDEFTGDSISESRTVENQA